MMRRAVNQVLEERRVGGNVNNGIRRGNQSRHVEIESNEGAGTGQQRTGTKNVKRNNWKSHLKWNLKIFKQENFTKRIFKRIKFLTDKTRTENELKGNPQRDLFEAENPLMVNGVIYCIIHLPTSKVYVGQTINGAHQRLLTHWHTRERDDFRSKGLHNQIRRHLHSSQFVVWPLEYIDPVRYTPPGGDRDNKMFRQVAGVREHYWVRQLRSLQPNGLNIYLPKRRGENRRTPRPMRFDARVEETNQPDVDGNDRRERPLCDKCVYVDVDHYTRVHTHEGPNCNIRRRLEYWLEVSRSNPEQLADKIRQSGKNLRLRILNWMDANMNAEQVDDHVQSVQTLIRSLLERYRRRPGNLKGNLKLLKLVYSHEAMEFADIRTVVNYPNIKNLLPDKEAPTICDKQLVPNSTFFCNFSKISKEIPETYANFPPSDQCLCKTLVHNYAELQEGHVMTTNYNCIKNMVLRKEFYYGAKYKHNMSTNSILESIELGVSDCSR